MSDQLIPSRGERFVGGTLAKPLRRPVLATQPSPRPQEGEVGLFDVLGALYRRRALIVIVVLVALGGAVLYGAMATPTYEASATLVIEPDAQKVVNFRPVVDESQQVLSDQYYETQYQVLKSRAIAAKTLERLHLWGNPRLAPAPGVLDRVTGPVLGLLARVLPSGSPSTPLTADQRVAAAHEADISRVVDSISVTPLPQSRLVRISFMSPTPEIASQVANGIAQAYIDDAVELRRQRSEEASRWLSDRLGDLRKQVDSREGALQKYRENKNAVSLDDQQNIVVQKLAQVNAAVTTARTERIEKQALYEQLRAAQASGNLESMPPVLSNNLIQKLQGDLATLQSDRAQLAQQLGPLHPDLQNKDAAIAATRRKLSAEVDKVAASVKSEYMAAQARERGLIGALEQQKQEVMTLNREAIGYGPLKRDAEATQQMFEALLQRVQEAELSGELETSNARLLDAAQVPKHAAWPRTTLNLLVALFGGLVVGMASAIGTEYMNRRISSPGDISITLGLPLLGITPKIQIQRGATALTAVPPVFRESLRSLRTRILLSPEGAGIRTLAVTSASPREGKTLVANQLAMSMALAGRRVLLVDGDTRRPQMHRLFGIPRSPGLTEVIKGTVRLPAALRKSGLDNLSILPAGDFSEDVTDLLDASNMKHLLSQSGLVFDLVVIDSPPVMALADASIIANAASSVLFVVEAETTERSVALAAIDRLVAAQAHVIGVVLNKADLSRRAERFYPYYTPRDADYYAQAVVGGGAQAVQR